MTEFKKYNRKYIIIQNLDDASLPGNSEVIEEGIVYVYTPTGEITDAEKVKVGDGTTTFGNLTWLFDLESIKVDLVNPTISISSSGLITAKATQPAGYTSGGTPTKTYQLSTQGSKTITPTTADQTAIAKNRYSTGAVTVKGDANLIPANIKEGVKIFNVTGTYSGETQTLPFEGELTLNVIGGRDTIELDNYMFGCLQSIDETANEDGLIYIETKATGATVHIQLSGEIDLVFIDFTTTSQLTLHLNIEYLDDLLAEYTPTLINEAKSSEIVSGKQVLNANREVVTGSMTSTPLYSAVSFQSPIISTMTAKASTEAAAGVFSYNQISIQTTSAPSNTLISGGLLSTTVYLPWNWTTCIDVASTNVDNIPNLAMYVQSFSTNSTNFTTSVFNLSTGWSNTSTSHYYTLPAGAMVFFTNKVNSKLKAEVLNSNAWQIIDQNQAAGWVLAQFKMQPLGDSSPTLRLTFYN